MGRAQRRLVRALETLCGALTVEARDSRGWASATFLGARHGLRVRLDGEDAATRAAEVAAALPEADLPMPGGFVADLIARADGAVLSIEALTIDEAEG